MRAHSIYFLRGFSIPFSSIRWILPVIVLVGCASTPPPIKNPAVEDHPVVGVQEGEQNRATINDYNQQIYNAERASTGSPTHAPVTPNTGIP